jgi:RNA polymerase sigma-70 factor, ECF subfamily
MEVGGFQDLLRRARDGDPAAVDRLLVLVRPHLERVSRSCRGGDGAAQSVSDLVQESWMRAWGRLDQFAGGRDDAESLAMFRGWASRIARNVCLQTRRNSRRKKRLCPRGRLVRLGGGGSEARWGSSAGRHPAALGSTPSAGVAREEEARGVRRALDGLPDPDVREVVRLRFFEGLSLAEIAPRLGLSYDQARDRFHRGMARLGAEIRRTS